MRFFLYLIFFIQAIVCTSLAYNVSEYRPEKLCIVLILCIFDVCMFFTYLSRRKQNGLNLYFPVLIFIVGYFVVFFQSYFDLYFGYTHIGDERLFSADSEVVNKCAWGSLAGLAAFMFGYILMDSNKYKPIDDMCSPPFCPAIPNIKFIMSVIYVITILYLISCRDIFMGMEYTQENLENRPLFSRYMERFLFALLVDYFAIVIYKMKLEQRKFGLIEFVKEIGIPFHIVLFLYVLPSLYFGRRADFMFTSIMYVAGFLLVAKWTLRMRDILFFGFLGAVLFTFIGIVRMDNNADKTARVDDAIVKITQNMDVSIIPVTHELSQSVRTFHNVVAHYPREYSYCYGFYPIREILTFFPFTAIFYRSYDKEHFRYQSVAYLCTWLVNGDYYTVGEGASINADLYLIAGIITVTLGMMFFGVLLGLLQFKMRYTYSSYFWIIFYIIMTAYCISISRATYFAYIKSLGFAFTFALLFAMLNKTKNRLELKRGRNDS